MLSTYFGFWEYWELDNKLTFFGDERLIVVNPGVTEIDVRADLWSDWVRWCDYPGNEKFYLAMRMSGLDPIPNGFTGDSYFLYNGWKLIINLTDVRFTGILYSDDYETPFWVYPGTSTLKAVYPATVSSLVNTIPTVENVITEAPTPDEIALAVTSYPMADVAHDFDTFAGSVVHLKHLEYTIFIDPEAEFDGEGSQHKPFDNETSALDYAEAHGIPNLAIRSDIEIGRSLKNFIINGIGTPKVEFLGLDLKNSKFSHCNLTGTYTDTITAQECALTGTFTLNGYFETCGLDGTFLVPDGGDCYVTKCTALEKAFEKPILIVGGVEGTATVLFMGYKGGLSVKYCNQPTDVVKIILDGGTVDIVVGDDLRIAGNDHGGPDGTGDMTLTDITMTVADDFAMGE